MTNVIFQKIFKSAPVAQLSTKEVIGLLDSGKSVEEIKKVVTSKRGNPIGVLVAKKVTDDVVKIGWSVCNWRDNFSKKRGQFIAENRANVLDHYNDVFIFIGGSDDEVSFCDIDGREIPFKIENDIAKFAIRCSHYFKTKNIFVSTVSV